MLPVSSVTEALEIALWEAVKSCAKIAPLAHALLLLTEITKRNFP